MLTKAMSESKETIFLGDMNANFLDNKDNRDPKSIFNVHGLTKLGSPQKSQKLLNR